MTHRGGLPLRHSRYGQSSLRFHGIAKCGLDKYILSTTFKIHNNSL